MREAVVLLSGGLDSTVALACAAAEGRVRLALTARYGQRAAEREVRAAAAAAKALGVPHEALDLPWLGAITRTALCRSEADLPAPSAGDLDDAEAAAGSADRVWVPNRNGVLIEVAAAFAEARTEGPAEVVVGFNREEAETFPDNTMGYVDRVSAALALSTRGRVRVSAPTGHLDKAQIIALGRELGAPLELVWPCYEGGDALCRRCESCRRFLRALDRADAAVWWEAVQRGRRNRRGHSA